MHNDDKNPLVRFGLFADAHYAETMYSDRYCHDTPAKLQACIDQFERSGLDFIVSMGAGGDRKGNGRIRPCYVVNMHANAN